VFCGGRYVATPGPVISPLTAPDTLPVNPGGSTTGALETGSVDESEHAAIISSMNTAIICSILYDDGMFWSLLYGYEYLDHPKRGGCIRLII
jgi:hypothetical protein